MGLFDSLFGGGESSQQSYIAPQQLPYLTGLWRGAQGYLPQAQALAQQYQPQANQLAGNVTNASNILNTLAGSGTTDQQIGVLQNTLNQNLTENLLPAIAQGANATGQLGRGQAGGRAGAGYPGYAAGALRGHHGHSEQ